VNLEVAAQRPHSRKSTYDCGWPDDNNGSEADP
jgi:hypothetical protein